MFENNFVENLSDRRSSKRSGDVVRQEAPVRDGGPAAEVRAAFDHQVCPLSHHQQVRTSHPRRPAAARTPKKNFELSQFHGRLK